MDSSQAPTQFRPSDHNTQRTPFADPDNDYTSNSASSDSTVTQLHASNLAPRSTTSHRIPLILAISGVLVVLFLVGLCVLAQVLGWRRRHSRVVKDGDSITKRSENSASEAGTVDRSKVAMKQAKHKWRSVWSTLCESGGYKFPIASFSSHTPKPTAPSLPTGSNPLGSPLSNYCPSFRSYTASPSYELATFPHMSPYPQVYYNHRLFDPNQGPPQDPLQLFDDAPLDPPHFYHDGTPELHPPVYQPNHQHFPPVHARLAQAQQQELWTWSAVNGFQPFLGGGDHLHSNVMLNSNGAQQQNSLQPS
ncbi:hypothetical protein MVLG_04933 [Microbotryum lychnidis-dioicae p1A1 Lamole]|uniref:Uncharacterized protein n=1 Tax=Microbotryum lychnidis-dioicae (strain p1A1 Lamole / MvSl-1064) TaxID=683840 RepID=U5HCQ5_USTV1|nr:hypothetical protein MVLG_04933 [Microbotryum lychnidis-dioicae p1A1 Lamole]|eukprot:KDE04633.1 hypothetical protein MVLG_04933 [Microbotryum lychnidis-dioicae p1A1 Lamole]